MPTALAARITPALPRAPGRRALSHPFSAAAAGGFRERREYGAAQGDASACNWRQLLDWEYLR
jgi:hypothetical protein